MIFHKQIEAAYKSRVFVRYDDIGIVKYFSYEDFPELNAAPYTFKSLHGVELKGYFYSYSGYNANRLVIFEHGFGGGHRSYMKEIERLCSAGYLVFAYDHTGCMESGGESTRGFGGSLSDLDACIRALKADESVNTSDISVMGHSWGGYSTLNISAIHPEVKRIVVLSGVVSVERMIAQSFTGPLKGYRKHIAELEREANPEHFAYDGVKTLLNSNTRALLIYSDNDMLVKREFHYEPLLKALSGKDNIELYLESGKGHNPNYSAEAVSLLARLGAATRDAVKLKTDEERARFKDSFDWDKMTEQDSAVWDRIIEFLK